MINFKYFRVSTSNKHDNFRKAIFIMELIDSCLPHTFKYTT